MAPGNKQWLNILLCEMCSSHQYAIVQATNKREEEEKIVRYKFFFTPWTQPTIKVILLK